MNREYEIILFSTLKNIMLGQLINKTKLVEGCLLNQSVYGVK